MERTVSVETTASPGDLFAVVSDLGTYQDWLDLVAVVEPVDPAEGEAGPIWLVTLRAEIGPLARSKRLRIVRTRAELRAEGTGIARFDRSEIDGRDHAAWTMISRIQPSAAGSQLQIELSYDGQLWTKVLEPALGHAIEDGLDRLPAYLSRATG